MRPQPVHHLPSRWVIFVVQRWLPRAKLGVFGSIPLPGALTSLHETHPNLSVVAPRHAATPPEPECELFRHLLGPDRELRPAERNVAYDAAQGSRTVAGIDLR